MLKNLLATLRAYMHRSLGEVAFPTWLPLATAYLPAFVSVFIQSFSKLDRAHRRSPATGGFPEVPAMNYGSKRVVGSSLKCRWQRCLDVQTAVAVFTSRPIFIAGETESFGFLGLRDCEEG
jgi:hypothetical protein